MPARLTKPVTFEWQLDSSVTLHSSCWEARSNSIGVNFLFASSATSFVILSVLWSTPITLQPAKHSPLTKEYPMPPLAPVTQTARVMIFFLIGKPNNEYLRITKNRFCLFRDANFKPIVHFIFTPSIEYNHRIQKLKKEKKLPLLKFSTQGFGILARRMDNCAERWESLELCPTQRILFFRDQLLKQMIHSQHRTDPKLVGIGHVRSDRLLMCKGSKIQLDG